jgi:hypothetical protein
MSGIAGESLIVPVDQFVGVIVLLTAIVHPCLPALMNFLKQKINLHSAAV